MLKITEARICTKCYSMEFYYGEIKHESEYRKYNCSSDPFNNEGHGKTVIITPEIYAQSRLGKTGYYTTDVKRWFKINGWTF